MAPSGVNNTMRENMAAIRRQFQDAEWADWGYTPTYATTDSFTLVGDRTGIFHAGRRIKASDSSDTFYGTIASATYSSNTRVSCTLDAGSFTTSLSGISVGILSFNNKSVPEVSASYARSAGLAAVATRAVSASAALNASYAANAGLAAVATRAVSASAALNASLATRAVSASAAGTLQGLGPSAFLRLATTSTSTVKQSFKAGFVASASVTLAGSLTLIKPGGGFAEKISIYAKGFSDTGAETLALDLEAAPIPVDTFTPSHKIRIWINNVEYWIQLDAV
jgi:hypothetical protein